MNHFYVPQEHHKKTGFSLVELAIVLVIIGLITGGILTGQELIRASELNSIATDLNKYTTAVNTFRLKYNALPGDIANAYSYWPTCGTNAATESSGCNGNGNGQISDSGGSVTTNESFRALQHMSLAGVIPGNYLGTFQSPVASVAGVAGCIPSKYTNVCFGIAYKNWPNSEVRQVGHTVFFGAVTATTGSPWEGAIPPAEMRSIDAKIDDGVSSTGKFTAWDGFSFRTASPNCNTTAYSVSVLDHQYNLSSTSASCAGKYFF